MKLADEKIESIEIYQVHNPSLVPTIIAIRTTSGFRGLGESGITCGSGLEVMPAMLAEFARRYVLGRSLADLNRILLDLTYDTLWMKRAGGLYSASLSAIDQALHDAQARALGIPLHELFGGRVHDRLRCYANGWFMHRHGQQELDDAARQVVADGHTGLKCYPIARQDSATKLHHPNPSELVTDRVDTAIEEVRHLREVVGEQMRIMVDLSATMPRDRIRQFLAAMAEFDVEFVEEPFDPSDESSLEWISSNSPVSLAGGERLFGLAATQRVLRGGGYTILQPDISLVGGHRVFQSIAAVALTQSVRIAAHNCASGITTAHTVQAMATVPNLHSVETYCYQHTTPGYREVVIDPHERRIDRGFFEVTDTPGIGVDLDDSVAADFLVHDLAPA